MISLSELKSKAQRKYWEVLKAYLQGVSLFPLVIRSDKRLPDNFEDMRIAVGQLVEHSKEKKKYGYRLKFVERKTRRHGLQTIPDQISFDTEIDFLQFIDKQGEAKRIIGTAENIKYTFPSLNEWVISNPAKVFKYLDQWKHILKVLGYFRDNPKPCMYARELPIDVHTKFIENHKAILHELLAIIIPECMNHNGQTFEEQFHLNTPQPLIRFRRLDAGIDEDVFGRSDDMAFPVGVFNRLDLQCGRVIIVENLMTYLTLPSLENSIAVYGGGFKVENLKNAQWLRSKHVFYWGDIDAHGYLILSLVRRFFPETESIMMDVDTFRRFQSYCVEGAVSRENDDSELNLNSKELRLFRKVRDGGLRLEQEHLSQEYIRSFFRALYLQPETDKDMSAPQ